MNNKKIFYRSFVIKVFNDESICMSGSIVDLEGYFSLEDEEAIVEYRRKLNDNRIYGYGIIGGDL